MQKILNWIDDRNEVQGKARIQRYFSILKAESGWEKHLASIDFVCIDPGTILAAKLRADARWELRHEDAHAIIFERRR